ncbi:MAG: TIGR02757 family protein [Actinomycetota bacterium]|nr:TIGR02757 family protein [Actinomycetota bacterium]
MGLKEELDRLYLEYNDRNFIHPDPLEFLYNYKDIADREIAGLIASSLAYGRIAQILKSVSFVLGEMIPGPYIFIKELSPDSIYKQFKDFRHRFTTGYELCCLLTGIKNVLEKYGSLNKCFLECLKTDSGIGSGTVLPAITSFAEKLNASSEIGRSSLIPSPMGRSAFKRLNLYLRWMVRNDNVDPGGWTGVPEAMLIIPLDTHIYRVSIELGFTKRKQADIKTALEITDTLKKFDKNDPVKYDFALTRLRIKRLEKTLHGNNI